jgi:hypothetical protein
MSRRLTGLDHAPGTHQHNGLRQETGLGQVVGDDDDRLAQRREDLFQVFLQLEADHWVQRTRAARPAAAPPGRASARASG